MSDERLDAETLRRALHEWTEVEADARDIPVSLEEIWAYVSDALPAEDAAGVMERIVADPRAARLAAAMASFHAERDAAEQAGESEADGVEALSARQLEDDWQRLSRRLGIAAPAAATPTAAAPPMRPAPVPASGRRRWVPAVAAAAAAAVIAALGAGFVTQSRLENEQRAPRLNVEPIDIWEDATRRGAAQPVQVPDDAAFHLLVLKLVPGDEGPAPLDFDRHAIEIWPAQEEAAASPLWRAGGVRLEEDLTVTLEISRGYLAPGAYELRLLGLGEAGEELLATFSIEIR